MIQKSTANSARLYNGPGFGRGSLSIPGAERPKIHRSSLECKIRGIDVDQADRRPSMRFRTPGSYQMLSLKSVYRSPPRRLSGVTERF